jgi:thymidine kinase
MKDSFIAMYLLLTQIVEYAHKLALDGKIIIISGLSGTFKMEPFENMSKLISIADEVVFCRSVCVSCTDDASFTLRTSNSEELVSIGGADTYKPVCRRCFVKENKFY